MEQRIVANFDLSFFKILVVEDNEINQKIFVKMFQRMGVQFKVVGGGAEALEALRNGYFDFVIMDCYMHPLSGFETSILIRSSQERFSEIPVIACSAGVFGEERELCRQAGMNDFLEKPVTYEAMEKKVREWSERVYEALPVLDQGALDKIRVFDDQHQNLLRSLFQIYSENTQEELNKMRDFVLDSQCELLRKKAHMLKSSAAQLGARRFEKFCHLMEHEENLDKQRMEKLFVWMSFEYEKSRKSFLDYCQNIGQISPALD